MQTLEPPKFENITQYYREGRSGKVYKCGSDGRAFLRNEPDAVVRGFGRTAAAEVEQESVMVTATINGKVSGNKNSFVYSTASKSASSGVLKE
jgi:hypothetical protein